ncbi:MAG: lysylphosphatidylglycerol synthase transmembrane domain-containing protein [Acidobacteriota bacterium]|nr:flippase-like domain-containing protein [Blastocatellia bacterium]MDW8413100.1 lysylphosphatidylglycerol synthase transmembrane domain-containing protein [Acidobacteriota bacterium]
MTEIADKAKFELEPVVVASDKNAVQGGSRRFAYTLLKLTVSFALIAAMLCRAGFGETMAKLTSASLSWLLAAAVAYFLGVFLRAWRWRVLLAGLEIKATIGQLSRLYLVGFFFNQIIPTGIGGDAMRAYMLAAKGVGSAKVANSVVVDRAAGLYSLLLMGAVAMLLRPYMVPKSTAVLLGAMVALATITVVLVFWSAGRLTLDMLPQRLKGRVTKLITDFYSAFAAYKLGTLLNAVLISFLFNLLLVLTNIFLAEALAINVSAWHLLFFVPIISATLLIPFSINGAGTRELTYVYLLGQVGISAESALAMSLSMYGLNLLLGILGAGCFVLDRRSA